MAERNYDLNKGGVKYDQDKPEWSLLPIKPCLEGVIRVLMYGAKKYTRDNWRTGMSWSRVLDATKRHILAWEEGENLDADTKLNHIDHALCELLFLRYYIEHELGTDDRYQKPSVSKEQETEWWQRLEDAIKEFNITKVPGHDWRVMSYSTEPIIPPVRAWQEQKPDWYSTAAHEKLHSEYARQATKFEPVVSPVSTQSIDTSGGTSDSLNKVWAARLDDEAKKKAESSAIIAALPNVTFDHEDIEGDKDYWGI